MNGTQEKSISEKVYQHFGLDLHKMLEQRQGHDWNWSILKREDAEGRTGELLRFEPEQNQRIIIDYDKDYDWTLVRRIRKEHWEAEEERGKEEFFDAVEKIAARYAAGLIKRINTRDLKSSEIAEGIRALESITAILEKIGRMKEAEPEADREGDAELWGFTGN